MGLFDWFRNKPRPTITDPVFGELTFEHGCWNGHVDFPVAGGSVAVSVHAGEHGPTPTHHRAFAELTGRYPALRAGIGQALWSLFQPTLQAISETRVMARGHLNGLHDAAAVLEATTLDAVDLAEDGAVRLR